MSDTDTHATRESSVTRYRCKDAEFSQMIKFTEREPAQDMGC